MSQDSLGTARVDTDPAWAEPVVGVIGGLGPGATALYLRELVALTDASRDQEHLDLVVLQHSTTPDRTAHILEPDCADDPGPSLARDAARLEALGAAFICVPCNTAHHFVAQMRAATTLPLLSIVDETARAAVDAATTSSPRVAVLATDGTRAAGVYQHALHSLHAQVVLPSPEQQHLVMSVITDVKAGGRVDVEGLWSVVEDLRCAGVDVVVLGCTELSLVYAEQGGASRPGLVDSVHTLAVATVLRAGKKLRR